MKVLKGYVYMLVGDYVVFDLNWLESKKCVCRSSVKVDDGMFASGDDEGGGMFVVLGDDLVKFLEKLDEECMEEEFVLWKL